MRLTRKKELAFCIRLWTWLASTGKRKDEYEFTKEELKHTEPIGSVPMYHCWFCEYTHQHDGHDPRECPKCVYSKKYGFCEEDENYNKWGNAETPADRKKYAKLFLKEIKALR